MIYDVSQVAIASVRLARAANVAGCSSFTF